MYYQVQFKAKAIKDCKNIHKGHLRLLFEKIELMRDNLGGDVKKLTDFTPEYRLRVGTYQVLFEIENDTIIIYRIAHRKDVYN